MTEDEARTAILQEWQRVKLRDKFNDGCVAAFCQRMAAEYNFNCKGDRVELIRRWVDQSNGTRRRRGYLRTRTNRD